MYINKDFSYITNIDSLLLDHGYGEMSVHSIYFDRYFTEEQKAENRRLGESLTKEEWSKRVDAMAKSFEKPMQEILSLFTDKYDVHQVSAETSTLKHFNSDWDLFFYSGKGNNKPYMDSFSLTFNKNRTPGQNIALLGDIESMIRELSVDRIGCRIQYSVELNKEKLAETALYLCETFEGKPITLCGKLGKIKKVYTDSEGRITYGFFKKGAKTNYYCINNSELVATAIRNGWLFAEAGGL